MSTEIFFTNWSSLWRVVVVGTLAYFALILLLRISGKRTLSKMNAFDLIVTVAFGSTLATVLLSKDVALAEGVTAFALLIGLQFAVTWLSVRSTWIDRLVKAEPSLLYFRGRMLASELRRERVTETEVHAAVRDAGFAGMDDVEAVVLETDGTLAVIQTMGPRPHDAMENTTNYDTVREGIKAS